jgi:WD40 repeat protein
MRADFFGELMKHAGLWEQFRDPGARYEVAPLSGPGLERAITKPALDKGVYVEARLVQALVADAGSEPGMMPFLQETLRDLWERMEFRVLPMSGYVLLKEAYGDPPRTRLHRALENHARAAMSGLAPERQEIAKRIMLRLIQLGDGRPDTRRQRTMAELEQVDEDRVAVHEVVEQLSAARLLTSTWSTDGAGVELVDLAHEALIESWDELRSSVKELRRDVRVRERLEDNASEWRRRDRHGGWLDDIELKEAQEWATTAQARRLGIDTGIVELIEASDARIRDQREAAERERDRRLRITRRWLAGAVAAVVAIGIVALVAWDQQQRAQRAADETKAVELATVSSQLADQSLDRALLLAIEANRLSPVPEAESSLVTALARLPALERVLRGHDAEVRAVAVSTEGAVIASAGRDHRIILWDSDGSRRRTIEGHTGEVHGLAFDRTGSILVSSSDDGTVRRWDPDSGAAIGASSVGHVGNVRGVAIDPAGRWFASAGHDATVRVWDLATGDEVTRLDDHRSEALDVAFSADGALLASAGQDGAVIVYRTEDFAEIARFELALPARAIAFNPVVDSQLAIGRQDWLVTVWDALTDDVVAELSGHDDRVFDVAFSPDGAAVASAGRDQKIIVHDVDTGRMLTELAGHSADVRSLAYTASGRLVSGSRDRTVMVWDPDQRPRLVETPHGPSAADGVELHPESGELLSIGVRDAQPTLVSGRGESVHLETLATRPSVIAVSPTGTPVVLGNRDGTISFVDGSSLRETGDLLDAHQAPVTALAVSADGEAAASGDGLGAIAVWDISDGEIVQRAQVAGFAVRDLHFDRDRDRLFVSDDSGTLWSFDLDGGLELRALADNRVRARHLAVSADGSTLVVGTGQDLVQLWDIDGVEPSVTSVIDHQGEVDAIAVDASGRIAAASAEAGTVTMWELESGRTLGQLPVTMPLSIALSSSPARLAVATPTGALTWTLDIDDMMTAACDVANRDLTPAEWEFYIGGSVDRTCTTA